ncbi:MAG: hypothetical protein WCO25_06220 [Candidatus Uhrbacteria bacterium]
MPQSIALFLILLIQLILLAAMLFMIHWHLVAFTSVPWVRTPRWKTKRMLRLAGLKPGERMLDAGSGDGSTVIDAARDFGATGHGIEMQWSLYWFSNLRARSLGLSETATFARGSMFKVDLPDADVVFSYLFPELNARLEPILKKRYPARTRVVSRTFPFPTLKEIGREKIGSETVFLYEL